MISANLYLRLLVLGVLFCAGPSFAESDAKKKTLPKTGSLSSSGSFGSGSAAVDVPWGDEDAAKGGAPISGSVSRLDAGQWLMKVFNNSKTAYSVNLEVVQFDKSGKRVKGDFYSYVLQPGKSAERKVGSASSTEYAELKLNNWRKMGKDPDEAKEKTEGAPVGEAEGEGFGE